MSKDFESEQFVKLNKNHFVLKHLTRRRARAAVFVVIGLLLASFIFILISTSGYFPRVDAEVHSAITITCCAIGIVSCIVFVLLVAQTKRERDFTENVLRVNKERYRSIIACSNTGAWEYHSNTGYQWCSPEYFGLLGYDPETFWETHKLNIQDIWINLLHPDDKEGAMRRFALYLANGEPDNYENYFRLKHRNGSWRWIWSRGRTLRNPDGSLSYITLGTHIDITENKNLEIELLRHNRKLLKYAHLNAHQVRGPLARLLGLIGVSRLSTELDYPFFFDKVEHEANSIDQVLSDIKDELSDIEEYSRHFQE